MGYTGNAVSTGHVECVAIGNVVVHNLTYIETKHIILLTVDNQEMFGKLAVWLSLLNLQQHTLFLV